MYKNLNIDYIYTYLKDSYYVLGSNLSINRYDSFHNRFLYKNETLLLVCNNSNKLKNFIEDMEDNYLYNRMIEIKSELGLICKNIKSDLNSWYDLDSHKIILNPTENNCKYVFFNYRIFSNHYEKINNYNFFISLFFCTNIKNFETEYNSNNTIIRTLSIYNKHSFTETETIYRKESAESTESDIDSKISLLFEKSVKCIDSESSNSECSNSYKSDKSNKSDKSDKSNKYKITNCNNLNLDESKLDQSDDQLDDKSDLKYNFKNYIKSLIF